MIRLFYQCAKNQITEFHAILKYRDLHQAPVTDRERASNFASLEIPVNMVFLFVKNLFTEHAA